MKHSPIGRNRSIEKIRKLQLKNWNHLLAKNIRILLAERKSGVRENLARSIRRTPDRWSASFNREHPMMLSAHLKRRGGRLKRGKKFRRQSVPTIFSKPQRLCASVGS